MLTLLRSLFVSSFAALALAQGQSPAPEPFLHEFGAPGERGSFRAQFHPVGGGMVFLQTMDHFVTLAAARHEAHTPDDYLLLAYNGRDHGLRLVGKPSATKFPEELYKAVWQVAETPDSVTFTLDSGNGLVLRRTLRHDPKNRGFLIEIALRNNNAAAGDQIEFELVGPALVVQQGSQLIGQQSVGIVALPDGTSEHVAPKAGVVQRFELDPRQMVFAGSTNRFFGAFLDPRDAGARAALTSIAVDTVPVEGQQDTEIGQHANSAVRLRYGMALTVPEQGAETLATYGLYLGPKSFREFETLDAPERYLPILDVDLNPPCCGIDVPGGRFMAKSLIKLLGWFHDLIGNWGLAIIMLTVLVRGSMSPLNFRMQKSMRAYSARMAVLKPKMDALKKQFGDDQKAYQQAMIAFQREHKVMPPLGGCLPIFLTMPIYIGLFTALRTAYDVRQQPFVGWITDLSSPDALFDLPFFPHHFNLLPLLWMACFVFLQTRTPLPTDPQQRQMQSIMRWMPLMFGFMLYGYASALMLYMVTSMLWSMVESAIVRKILGPVDPNVASMTPTVM
ncbi:MAG: membrane protein insertase YidC [Planctomycetes bacterium]|nr:membrane protein insertase YidC [Planctomycetota bacterium]MCB9887105.1 membrane protein insertase YidC [Planctomycetota bacterium]